MPTVVLKLFAGQGTVTDGRTKRRLYTFLSYPKITKRLYCTLV